MAKEYPGFELSGDMSYGDKTLLFYRCNTCSEEMSENSVAEHECTSGLDDTIVKNPPKYEGFTVVSQRGICKTTPEGILFYNCDACGSTIAEKTIKDGAHKCWAKSSIEEKLD